MPFPILPERIKIAANAAFRDNWKRELITWEDREIAASFYELVASDTKGWKSETARLYNLERALFLRGKIDYIASSAPAFEVELRAK